MKNLLARFKNFIMFAMLGFALQMNYTEDKEEDIIDKLYGVEPVVDEDGNLIDEDVELEGLGRLFRSNRFNVSRAKQHYSRLRHYRRKRKARRHVLSNVTKGQLFIVGNKKKFTSNEQKALMSGNYSFKDGMLYFTKSFTSLSSSTDLIESNDTLGTGYSNLEEMGMVPKGTNMAVDYIAFAQNQYDGHSETLFTNKFEKAYTSSDFASAELKVTEDGKVIFSSLVGLLNESRVIKKGIPSSEHWGINLRSKLLIKAESKIQFELKMPSGVSITPGGTTKIGLRVILMGDATGYKTI